jgi:uncharacterized membrane-anchored protein
MQIDHVPEINGRYWALLAVCLLVGANSGDLMVWYLGRSRALGVPFVALVFVAVLFLERRDRSSGPLWYWLAVTLIPMTSDDLVLQTAKYLDLSRPWLIVALAVTLVVTFLVARSDAMHVVEMNLMSRDRHVVPLTDITYWLGLLVASMLGSVLCDVLTTRFGLRLVEVAILVVALLAGTLALKRRARLRRRLILYWVNVIVIVVGANTIGRLVAADIGLKLSVVIGAAIMGGLLLHDRRKAASRPDR